MVRVSAEVSERRAAQEIEQVARFDRDPAWRRGRIRDVVAARELLIEINDSMFRGIAERGATTRTSVPNAVRSVLPIAAVDAQV